MDITAQDADLVRRDPWFARLPSPLQARILGSSEPRTFRKGETLIREGEPGRGMGVVIDGQVHMLRRLGDAHEVLVDIGGAGIWIGNYGTLTGGAPSIGSVVAATPVRVLFLPLAAFERIVDDEPRYYRLFAENLLDRYAHMFGYLAEAQGLSPEDWVHRRLLDLARVRRAGAPQRRPVSLSLSQSELATLVGFSRQTLAALLARLEARGLIEVRFRSIRVLA